MGKRERSGWLWVRLSEPVLQILLSKCGSDYYRQDFKESKLAIKLEGLRVLITDIKKPTIKRAFK